MLRYIANRLLAMVPVLLGVSVLVFLIIHITPGDPVRLMAGQQADPEVMQNIRKNLGLDLPIHVQYFRFLGGALKGDLGRSYKSNRPVLDEVLSRIPNTLELALVAMVLALIIGIGLGVIAAYKRNSWVDSLTMVGAIVGVSVPGFWIAMLLMLSFSLNLRWLPASGRGGALWTADGIVHIILPAFTLAWGTAAVLARLTRATMLEVLRHDFIRTARAKGVGYTGVLLGHALRNALIPVLTMAGIQFGDLLANTTVIETVFAWPGVSRLGVQAIWSRDYPLVQGVVLFVSLSFVLINLGVDVLYAYLDPRIRYE